MTTVAEGSRADSDDRWQNGTEEAGPGPDTVELENYWRIWEGSKSGIDTVISRLATKKLLKKS